MSDPNPRSGTPGGIRDTTSGQSGDDEGRTPSRGRDTEAGQTEGDDKGADRQDDEPAAASDRPDAD